MSLIAATDSLRSRFVPTDPKATLLEFETEENDLIKVFL